MVDIYRTVATRIWLDSKVNALSHDAQRVWFWLLTNPESSPIPGVVICDESKMSRFTDLHGRFGAAFCELLELGMCEWFSDSNLVFMPKCIRYRMPQNQSQIKGWEPYWRHVKEGAGLQRVFDVIYPALVAADKARIANAKKCKKKTGEKFADVFSSHCPRPVLHTVHSRRLYGSNLDGVGHGVTHGQIDGVTPQELGKGVKGKNQTGYAEQTPKQTETNKPNPSEINSQDGDS